MLIASVNESAIESVEDFTLALELVLRDVFRHAGHIVATRDGADDQLVFETANHAFRITVQDLDTCTAADRPEATTTDRLRKLA